jgi:hypothetical protein
MLFDHVTNCTGQFPDHPHSGFEVVGYLLEGHCRHEDHLGNKGETFSWGGQWFTAGRGIVHAEKIESKSLHAVVVWVNLRSDMKFVKPAYQQFTNSSIKRVEDWNTGITATILAGSALGQTAQTITRTPSTFLDFQLEKNSVLIHAVSPGWNSLIYILEGQVEVAGLSFGPKQTIVLTKSSLL